MAVSDDKTRVMITMTKELRNQLEEEASKDNRNLSNYILHLLQNRKK